MTIRSYQRLVLDRGEMSLDSPMGPSFWLHAYEAKGDLGLNLELAVAYLSGQTIVQCWQYVQNRQNREDFETMADWFVEVLRKMPLDALSNRLALCKYMLYESKDNIPQISSFDAATLQVVDILARCDKGMTYEELGYQLYHADHRRSVWAKKKYGENAAKFAAVLGLVDVGHGVVEGSSELLATLTPIGRAVSRAKGDRVEIIVRLFLKLALFRDFVVPHVGRNAAVFQETVDLLSLTTRHRRASSFAIMQKYFLQYGGFFPAKRQTDSLLCHMRH